MPKWRLLGATLSLVLFGAALLALHHLLAEVHLADVLARFRATSPVSVALALVCVAGSYLALTGYDVLALRHLGKPMPYPRAALASFTSYTFSHNIGLSLITGGSIRYRIYSAAGLSATEVATLTGLCALTFGLGVSLLLALALLLEPSVLGAADKLPAAANRLIGALLLVAVTGYAIWTGVRRAPIRLKDWSIASPGLGMTLAQFALGAIDIGFAAGALYLVLPPDVGIGFAGFVGIYVAAMSIGLLSHAPGGLGIFEAVMLLALPGAGQAGLFGALLVYRCLYYLLPLALAAVLLSWHELHLRRAALGPVTLAARRFAHAIAPPVIGAAVFAGGAILLFSAATPALAQRVALIKVAATIETRAGIIQLVDIFGAQVVDVSQTAMTIELTGTEDQIDSFVNLLRPFGIKEMARTGRVAMLRGN
ncbi:MAG: acetolactate synthase small subunit [Burkholderiales bacterium]|nr:MAG: acetolactate synthase small subunit [Burkholderiales bacterium]